MADFVISGFEPSRFMAKKFMLCCLSHNILIKHSICKILWKSVQRGAIARMRTDRLTDWHKECNTYCRIFAKNVYQS
jgi:hypothetical protein